MKTEIRKTNKRQRKCLGLTEQYVTGSGSRNKGPGPCGWSRDAGCVVLDEAGKKTCSEFAGPRSFTHPSTDDQQKHEMSFFSVKVLVLVKRSEERPSFAHTPPLWVVRTG